MDGSAYAALSLALIPSGDARIAYRGDNYGLKYAWLDHGVWYSVTVDATNSAGAHASLALAPTLPYTPYISYAGPSSLKYATYDNSGGTWVSESVDVGSGLGT